MKITPLILAALMLSTSVFADVNPRNGNFSITFREMSIDSDGHELSLRRTFNSLSTAKGWFGLGWGSRFETRLVAMPDDSIVVQDNGTGRKTAYFGDRFNVQVGVARILTAVNARKMLSPAANADLARQLMDNDDARFEMVRELDMPVEVGPHQMFKTDGCDDGTITRTDSGFARVTCDGVRETFDAKGRLTSAVESDGYGFEISYQNGLPDRIVDTNGQTIRLGWTPAGFLKGASHDGVDVQYVQDDKGNLASAKDERSKYLYTYDDFHNLKTVTFSDASTVEVDYVDALAGRTGSVKDRLGNQKLYAYSGDPDDPFHTFTRVTHVPADKAQGVSVSEFEFNEPPDSWTEQKTLPSAGAAKAQGAASLHDAKGRAKRKADAKGNLLEIVYHPRNDKIIMVFTPKVSTEVRYSADDVMEQVIVRTVKGHVTLNYFPSGKLMGMEPDSLKDPESIRAVAMALQNLVELQSP